MNKKLGSAFFAILTIIFFFIGKEDSNSKQDNNNSFRNTYRNIQQNMESDNVTLKYNQRTNNNGGDYVLVTLKEVNFEFNDAKLTEIAKNSLLSLSPFVNEEYIITIIGHTDKVGTAQYNQLLSDQRANNVKYYLSKMNKVGNMIEAYGVGENFPIVNIEEENLENRRVEIKISKKEVQEKEEEEEKESDWLQNLANIAAIISAITAIAILFI